MKNITRTFLRSDQTMTRYMKEMKNREKKGVDYNPFTDLGIKKIQEFTHWFIIDNNFPYDAVATTSHLIATKRQVSFDWDLLTEEELTEFTQIRKEYLIQHYDVLYENLPKGQTVPGHFHLHLLVLKRQLV